MRNPHQIALALSAILAASAFADDPKELETTRSAYQQSVQRATEPLKTRYLADLARLRETFTRAGKLTEALAVDAEIKALSGQSAGAASELGDAPKGTVVISARSDTGTSLGPAKKGQKFRVQYVDGVWTSSGNTNLSPDSAPHGFVKVALIGVAGGKEEIVALVPNGTKARAFSDEFKKDYEQVWLRINDNSKNDNSGDVTYKASIK